MTRGTGVSHGIVEQEAGREQAVLDSAVATLRGRRLAVLTGAGLSTDSGIPDYRGAGAAVRTPLSFDRFVNDETSRRRYWAGSHQGWRRFAAARPNAGHRALVDLESHGAATGVITQNVDELHRRAGSQIIVELHGSMGSVRCLRCGQYFARQAIAALLSEANPWLDDASEVQLAPDGDAAVSDSDTFTVPNCPVCDGMLKPNVVFFGEFIPRAWFAEASALLRVSDALVIAGSSLAVNSGIRLLDQAHKRRLPIVIINRGPTKGDSRATVRLEAGTSETLTALARELRT